MKYVENRVNLCEYLDSYSYFPKLTDFIFGEMAHEIRRKGYLDQEEFILILFWKRKLFQLNRENGEWLEPLKDEDSRERAKTVFFFEPDEMKIQSVTKKIFNTNHFVETEVADLIQELSSLRGVQPKTATAILSVVFPILYGVVDFHVENQLGIHIGEGPLEEKAVNSAKIVFELRKIAYEQRIKYGGLWTPRMVDMGLFVLNQLELARQEDADERSGGFGNWSDDCENDSLCDEETEAGRREAQEIEAAQEEGYLPWGYDDILHPKEDDDYDTDDERD